MKRFILSVFLAVILSAGIAIAQVDINDTRFLNQPAVATDKIAFIYANDLWTADLDGSNPRKLTSDHGRENNPVFSPDGTLIAFSAQYDGNTDVFVIPASGGVPKRLTWHPGGDTVRGFTPDGNSVLFVSSRFVFARSHAQLFTVPVTGGYPERLEIPNAVKASYSPDGSGMAYTPLGEAFRQWKNYRGGTTTRIWLYDFADHSVVQIPQPEERCSDTDPMWIGDKVYFISDRNGEFNLFSYEISSEAVTQLTRHNDFPIIAASGSSDRIIYEQAGQLHMFNLSAGSSTKLKIGIAADLLELRPRYAKGANYIRSSSLSPSGARVVFGFRGEIVTVPAKKGDPRNLTSTVDVHENFPAWSPDGKNIAYFSDESGEYQLFIAPQDGKGDIRKFKLSGAGFYANPIWSPDSKMLTFADNSRTLFWIDTENGRIKKIATEELYSPGVFGSITGVWSHDSKWIAYTLNSTSYMESVYVYSVDQDKSFPLTDGLSDVSNPVFDKSGKYMYFFASTDAGPVKHWFAMSNADMEMSRAIYLVTLQKETESPLAKESDEEKVKEDEGNKDDSEDKPEEETFNIDFDGIESRIITVPVETGSYYDLQAGNEGQIYFLEAPAGSFGPFAQGTKLHMYDLGKRKDNVILPAANGYEISHDGKKILYRTRNSWGIVDAGSPKKAGEGKISADAVEVFIDPAKEWKQIFNEAWRVNRDYFYDPNFHGADWDKMLKKYEPFVQHLSCRDDLNSLIRWMCSELAVGHHRVGGGDYLHSPKRVPGGLLGADFTVENGRYRISKVYGGLNWNPELRSPLTEPGVGVMDGEYILSVNGRDLTSSVNIFSMFENTSGKIVEMEVGPNPDGTVSRTVKVVPVGNERSLRNRDWVEGNIKKVTEATNGRVAYVYVPNTTGLGHTYFKRYFFPQADREAIIIDERFNGGGQVADYYIDIMRRPFVSYWALRYGKDVRTPSASIPGPKVMLINESAGSGGDLLPWMFRKFNIGKLIGRRTWGGLVGVLGFPTLMDGGVVTAPNLAIWTEEGFVVENVGVPPDIEVEQWPAEVIRGRDPQLEKAIEVVMEELRLNPVKKMKKPPYPVRVKK